MPRTKKTTPKKRTAKKAPSRRVAKEPRKRKAPLVVVEGEGCFWVHDGPILRSLRELHYALAGEITDEQFTYHTANEKNDFAAWVAGVLGDAACAKRIRALKRKPSVRQAIGERLAKHYQVGKSVRWRGH